VSALDSDRTIAQFHHTAWTAREGAPPVILSIAQTNDGYLWLGSLNGLFRFDGVRFEQYQPTAGGSFPSREIGSLLALPDGGLWIGFRRGGASLLEKGRVTNFGESEGLPPGRLASLAQDQSGTVWAAVSGGGLARLENGRWQHVGAEWNFPGKSAQVVFVDRQGTLWVATDDTVVFLPRSTKSFQPTGEHIGVVCQMVEAPDGRIWLAETSRNVRPVKFPDQHASIPEIRAGSQSILFDETGALWATSVGDGIAWVRRPQELAAGVNPLTNNAIEMFTQKDGLTDNVVLSAFQDREKNIWIGTPKGLERFRKGNLVPVAFPPGYQAFAIAAGDNGTVWTGSNSRPLTMLKDTNLTVFQSHYIGCGYRDPDGETWMGSVGELFRIKGGKIEKLRSPLNIEDPAAVIAAITRDHAGRAWIAMRGGSIWTVENNRWERYENPALPKSAVTAEYTDAAGRVWFGYNSNTVAAMDHGQVQVLSQKDGVAVGGIKVIRGQNDNVWIGGESGLAFLKEGRFHMLEAEGSQAFSGVSGIVETADGSLWLSESRGIIQVTPPEVQAALLDPAYKVRYQLFDYADGLPGAIQQVATPTAIEGTDGRLWFATVSGLVWIDPAHVIRNHLAPAVSVRSIITAAALYPATLSARLPMHTANIQIDYTALSLAAPERVFFRYRLENVDKDWQEAGTRRQAFFSNLGPGDYRFRVIASNNDGLWNETGATLEFNIAPAFYQTGWFLAICIVLILAGLYPLYLLRIKHLHHQVQSGMEARLAERESIARDLHDTLLQSVQGLILKFHAIAHQIPVEEPVRQTLDKALDHADLVLAEGRDRVRNLRANTVEYGGLPRAFQRVADEAPNRTAEFKTVVEGSVRELHAIVREESYAIGREALVNALTHSGALHIEVEITYDSRQFRLRIRDDGRGIDPAILEKGGRAGHWGMQGLRERAARIGGALEIWSGLGAGTEVELIIPAASAYKPPHAGSKRSWVPMIFTSRSVTKTVSEDERQ
jgi:signal transduction histidine kinase/ligand-binding sensor domain-containing protein